MRSALIEARQFCSFSLSICPSATMQAYQTSPPNLPSEPGVVKLSDEERQSGKWSRDNMQRAVELMHRDGLLVVQGVVDTAHLELIRESMLKTAGEIREAKTKVSDFNHGVRSNFLQAPPLSTPALLFDDVYANDFVLQIVEKYLGDGLRTPFITANVALSNTTQRQPVQCGSSLTRPTDADADSSLQQGRLSRSSVMPVPRRLQLAFVRLHARERLDW